jgi:hypothetical protein
MSRVREEAHMDPIDVRPGDSSPVWLWDPGDELGDAPVMCSPGELAILVADALRSAGLTSVAIAGTFRRPQRIAGRVHFDVSDRQDPDAAQETALPCVASDSAGIVELCDGTSVRAWGSLRWDKRASRLRLDVDRLDILP